MIFLIVGVGRSGTSLLQSILSSHSEICLPPETGFIRHNVLSCDRKKGFTIREIKSTNKKLSRVIPEIEHKLPTRFSNEIEFFELLLKAYKDKQSKDYIGDKDPRLVEFINAVSDLLPDTKFIHLVRDPRDVLLSKKKAEWSRRKPSWYHIFANYIQVKLGEKKGKKLGPSKYMITTYEDLLAEPEKTISGICAFLEVDFEQSMLSFQDKAKELVSEEEKQWKKETMGPLMKDNTGKWKGKLDNKEVVLTEWLCKQAFRVGGYEKSNTVEELSWIEKVWLSLQVTFLKGSGCIYMMYRFFSQKILVKWKY